jgi:folate-binding protein YgfZ
VQSSWHDFLLTRGAHIEAGAVAHFGAPEEELRAAQSGTIVADLSSHALIEASGEDACEFLNNQLTTDISVLDSARATYAGYCSPKGRLLANFLLWQQQAQAQAPFLLRLEAGLRETIQKRLSMYVLRSKVKLADASAQWVCLGVAGAQAGELLRDAIGAAAQQPLAIARHDAAIIITLEATRYQLVLPATLAASVWDVLSARARPVGAPVWCWLDIRAGIPWIMQRTQEQFVPQMANFDRIGALTYGKGCYPGQEIVARTHYLGKLKRRMYLGHVRGTTAPLPGDELYSAAFGEQSCGMIMNAAAAPDGGYDLLAVIQLESRDEVIHISSMSGESMSILTQPYTLG